MIKPRPLRTIGFHSAMAAEVLEEVVIDCVALFYEEGQGEGGGGGGNHKKKNNFSCRVNTQEKRLVKFREAIW